MTTLYRKRAQSGLLGLIAAFFLASCSTPPQELDAASAAQNCDAQGGKLVVERGPDGVIGICVFEGNRQCEQWALLLGRCARGGISVTGYATTSERHCAIRGGHMTIPGCALSPVGLYEARNVLLVLQAGRSAMLRRVHSGGDTLGGDSLAPGIWHSSGKVVTVSTEHERLVFDYAGDRLIAREWNRRIWGAEGPGTLVRQK